MNIRNFAIISHIDHGKSTLADRLLELTGALSGSKLREQTLDTMDLERERGITIKLNPARLKWKNTQLNLIDTPGHVDFSYEVSRSLAAVEGALLLVDASQGIQAQTLANLDLARVAGLAIIGVINKIDLPSADIGATESEIRAIIGQIPMIRASGKTGEGVPQILDTIIDKVSAPAGSSDAPLRALIFDSVFDQYRGVIAYVRIVDGALEKGDTLRFIATASEGEAQEVGYMAVERKSQERLATGEIGYVITGLKDVTKCRVGDTITAQSKTRSTKIETARVVEPLAGYREPRPMVFAGLYTGEGEATQLRTALEKLALNDSALQFKPHHSKAFGFGFTVGFLGILHLEITRERLIREYDLEPVITAPSVEYHFTPNGIEEPWVALDLLVPRVAIGPTTKLAQDARAIARNMQYIGERVLLTYEAPLAEIITNFYDQLKSATAGYGSMSHEFLEFRPGDLIGLDVALGGEDMEAFHQVVPRIKAERRAREIAQRLKTLIPRQLFEVRIQVKIGGPSNGSGQGKIIASESISPLRKDVTAKLYGGDVTRKRKLLEKQKKGKARMRRFGKVEIPSDIFVKLLQ